MKRLHTALLPLLFCAATMLGESQPSLTQRATSALFQQSDSSLALQLAKSALKKNRHDVEAAFVAMEAATMQADDSATLDAALTVVAESAADDPRSQLAASRIETLAENSATFKSQLPRLQKLASSHHELRLALVAAANDGAAELNQLASSRDAGLVTDWRVAGPFGRNSLLDFDKRFEAEVDWLRSNRYGKRAVEQLQFATGTFTLPDYFQRRGVYYASSELYVTSDGMWNIFIETPGTARVFIDGNPAVTRDERKPAQPELLRTLLHLTQGKHRLLVKFTASASPFRVAVLAPTGSIRKKQSIPVLTASPESEYVIASLDLRNGNVVDALHHAQAAQKAGDSAIAHWLLARCWKKAHEDAPEVESELNTAMQLDASASRVRLELAQHRLQADRTEEGLALLKQAATAAPRNELVLLTEAKEFARLAWSSEADATLQTLVAEHPSCENLMIAANFYSSGERIAEARRMEDRLSACSPNSLDGVRAVSRRGDHLRAAQLALKVAAAAPYDRNALELATRELMLTGDVEAAHPIARQLAELAPNSDRYRQMLRGLEGDTVPKNASPQIVAVLGPYRRDGIEMIRQAAAKKYSGGPAVWTLNDAVVADLNGERWQYTHRIVRLLNRDGVLNYGEVAVPHGAEVLTLRTIAADGRIAEPEFNQHKATVSMPALAPGDSIEEEFLQRVTGEEAKFEFGSFDAPILYSRFTMIGAADHRPIDAPAKAPTKALANDLVASTWEYDDLAQPAHEASIPSSPQFPSVTLAGDFPSSETLREHVQEQMLGATVPGPRAFSLVREFATTSQVETARRLYRHVMKSVEDGESDGMRGEVTSGEESLENNEGDRAAALIALSRAAGIEARLLLAREMGSEKRISAYLHPVVEFTFSDGKQALADMENDALPLGSVNPQLDVSSTLPVIAFRGDAAEFLTAQTALIASTQEEHSTADGKVEITADGQLRADVTIRMAPWRAAQMRAVLRTVNATDRPRFFQQLAMRLFPGVTDATGDVTFENDPDQPLSIHVVCRATSFVDFRRRSVDIDQITPALGLRTMYAKSSSRTYPLAIDAVLFESSVFQVVLPEGVSLANGVLAEVKSEFGTYSTSVRQVSARVWEMNRDFNIPLQIVSPDHYQAFSAFANRIDAIERQRLSLRINRTTIQPVSLQRQ
jgi:cellulose synthase operon protein C